MAQDNADVTLEVLFVRMKFAASRGSPVNKEQMSEAHLLHIEATSFVS
jgi:hypothetical protein